MVDKATLLIMLVTFFWVSILLGRAQEGRSGKNKMASTASAIAGLGDDIFGVRTALQGVIRRGRSTILLVLLSVHSSRGWWRKPTTGLICYRRH